MYRRGGLRNRALAPYGAAAQVAVEPHPRRARAGAGAHRARGVGALRAAGRGVGADRGRGTHAGAAREGRLPQARAARAARGRGARRRRRVHRGARRGRPDLDPEPHDLLRRSGLRLRPASPDAPGRAARAPGRVRHARRGAQGARRHRQADGSGDGREGSVRAHHRPPSPPAREVPGETDGAPLRGPADPVHRSADRRHPERERHEGRWEGRARLLRRDGARASPTSPTRGRRPERRRRSSPPTRPTRGTAPPSRSPPAAPTWSGRRPAATRGWRACR